ncbi:hypothetical protein [Hugenholtzia roseola]|uniref:hypothetical protein n=1 Tax=Hugenholtzia roseola TaxID=1002 RepID=UPI0003FCD39F|nr:hypothetical protein [Hugenholtzia roseola]
MKTIITTVGTSLFENYNKKEVEDKYGNYETIFTEYETLRDKRSDASEYDEEGTEEEKIIRVIKNKWFKGITKKNKQWTFESDALNEYASAEIESILAIQKEAGEEVEVHLLATDTVLSRLAAELICTWFDENDNRHVSVTFNPNQDVIKELQVEDGERFKKGLVNLNTRFYQIAQNSILGGQFDDVIINVTGGYKGIIPYLTILGQINQSPIKYIFENTGVLITIPQIPIQFNEDLFEKHWEVLSKLENDMLNSADHRQLIQDLGGCFDVAKNGDFMFNYLGEALWGRYKSKFFIFYAPDEVWNEIQKQKDIQRIIAEKLSKEEVRKGSKNEKKGDKWCYDDGDNDNRIYNLTTNDGKYVIYKTFESEVDARKYINATVDFESLIKYSKPRKVTIE